MESAPARYLARLAPVAAIGIVVGLGAAPAGAAPATSPSAGEARHDCTLVDSELTASASVDAELTERFAEYGDSGDGWTGADSTFSLPLSGGREGWFFSDTFLGAVNPDGSRPADAPFVNNSIVVDDHGELTTVVGGSVGAPESIVPPTEDGAWHWIGDPTYGRHGDVQIPLLQFEKFGPGSFDFGWTANRLAILDGTSLELQSVEELPSATGINWGSWTVDRPLRTFVYGIRDIDGVRSAFVARVLGADGLRGHWFYWDGSGWSREEADAAPIASNVANEFSVTRFRDGWLMVTHDTSEIFSTRIVAQVSCSPTGPFHFAAELYRTPETGAAGSYGDPDVFTYNAHEHPELRDGDTLLVTYNVNTFDNVGDVYDDVTIYRPRFLEVELNVTP